MSCETHGVVSVILQCALTVGSIYNDECYIGCVYLLLLSQKSGVLVLWCLFGQILYSGVAGNPVHPGHFPATAPMIL